MEIKQQIDDVTKRLDALVFRLNEMITALPDNPRINRIGKNCFALKKSDLGDNWTPEYHDFKKQYAEIVLILRRSPPAGVIAKLQSIVDAKQIRVDNYNLNLHPDVVANLKTLLD